MSSPENQHELFEEFHFDFDHAELRRFLDRLAPLFEHGFGVAEIEEVLAAVDSLQPDQKSVCEFSVRFRGRDTRLIAALYSAEDVAFPTLFLYSLPHVIAEIEAALSRFTEEDVDEDSPAA
jgi:hypothetical protein